MKIKGKQLTDTLRSASAPFTNIYSAKVTLGAGNDLELFHDGSNSVIKDTAATGGSTIHYRAGTQTFQNKDANKTMAVFNASSSVDLHYNGSKKFETTSSGVQTTGTLSVNGAYQLPSSDGSANQMLKTDGSGAVTFTTAKSASHIPFGYNEPLTDETSPVEFTTMNGSTNGQGWRMPVAGEVTHVTIQADCVSSINTVIFYMLLYKNGSQVGSLMGTTVSSTGVFGNVHTLSSAISFSAGDRLMLKAYHNQTGGTTADHAVLLRVVTDTY